MLGPSTGTLRRFKRSEDHASGMDLVFIMLGGVPINVEDHWTDRRSLLVASSSRSRDDAIGVFFLEKTTCI
jgi:hypothetical protein